jgi:PAS domain S-box-containing protein
LRNAEFDLLALFEKTPDLVCIAGKDGYFRKINPAVIEKLGYSEKELFANPIASFVYPEDRERTSIWRTQMINGEALLNFENRYVTKKGKIIWLEWTSIYFPDKEIVFAIAKDVSKRKQIQIEVEEKYKKFKGLATHFKKSIEVDRKYLATELHEELAQLASIVKMDIAGLSAELPDLPASSKSKIEHALVLTELLVKTIRRISFSISPNMLDHLGLNATLEWHCKEFAILNGIPCSFESAYNEEDLTQELKIDFFRICQESLSNVMYHAEATHVKISIENVGNKIALCIIDDGKGFDISQINQKTGLTRLRERAASINGELIIESERGKGTRVCITIDKE